MILGEFSRSAKKIPGGIPPGKKKSAYAVGSERREISLSIFALPGVPCTQRANDNRCLIPHQNRKRTSQTSVFLIGVLPKILIRFELGCLDSSPAFMQASRHLPEGTGLLATPPCDSEVLPPDPTDSFAA
jgi:hypothetical protein